MKLKTFLILALTLAASPAFAEKIGCVTTEWKLIGANHKVCIESLTTPKCPASPATSARPKPAGSAAASGWRKTHHNSRWPADKPDQLSCPKNWRRKPSSSAKTPRFYSRKRASFVCGTRPNRTLIYLAISRKLIDGAPANSISTVPVMPWGVR